MKKTLLAMTFLLLSSMSYATEETTIECKEDGTQAEMNSCAYDTFEKADKELNRVYNELRKVKKEDKLFLKNLKKSQKAWIVFRDLDLKAQFTCESGNIRACFGSMYALSFNSAKAELTNQRVKTLKGMLDEASL